MDVDFTMNDKKVPDGTILMVGIRYLRQTTGKVWTYALLKAGGRWFGTGTMPSDAGWLAVMKWLSAAEREIVFVRMVTGVTEVWPRAAELEENRRFCGDDAAHGAHVFVANDEPDSPDRSCPGLTADEVQYHR